MELNLNYVKCTQKDKQTIYCKIWSPHIHFITLIDVIIS